MAFAAEELTRDRDVVLAAVASPHEDPWREATALFFAADELKADREVALAAVRGCGVQLESVAEGLREDAEVVEAAGVQHDLGSFKY